MFFLGTWACLLEIRLTIFYDRIKCLCWLPQGHSALFMSSSKLLAHWCYLYLTYIHIIYISMQTICKERKKHKAFWYLPTFRICSLILITRLISFITLLKLIVVTNYFWFSKWHTTKLLECIHDLFPVR